MSILREIVNSIPRRWMMLRFSAGREVHPYSFGIKVYKLWGVARENENLV